MLLQDYYVLPKIMISNFVLYQRGSAYKANAILGNISGIQNEWLLLKRSRMLLHLCQARLWLMGNNLIQCRQIGFYDYIRDPDKKRKEEKYWFGLQAMLSNCAVYQWINGVLSHDPALQGYTGSGTTWPNAMNYGMNHAPGVPGSVHHDLNVILEAWCNMCVWGYRDIAL